MDSEKDLEEKDIKDNTEENSFDDLSGDKTGDEDSNKETEDKEGDKPLKFYTSDKEPLYKQTSKKGSKIFLLIVVLILVAAGFIFRHQIKGIFSGGKPTPTPTSAPTAVPVSTTTPAPLVRSDWSFEVLNGTGVSGLAKTIADKITALGYTVVKVGNADKSNYQTTQILVKSDLKDKVDLVVADLKNTVKIASFGGELKDSTASARIIIGKDLTP